MAAEQIIANLVMQVEAQTKGVERVAKIVEDLSKNVQGIVKPLQDMTKSMDASVAVHKRVEQAQRKQARATTNLGKKSDTTEKVLKRLEGGLENVAKSTQLALGPLSGWAARITTLNSIVKNFNPSLAALAVGFTGFAVSIGAAIQAGSLFEQKMLRIGAVLEATNNPMQFTVEQVDAIAVSLAEATLTATDLARDAAAALLTFENIGPATFERTLTIAQGLSATFGQGLVENVKRFGKVLSDPIKNLGALSEAGVQFNKEQQEQIKLLVRQGRLYEAQQIVLERFAFAQKVAAQEAGGYAGAVDTLQEKFGKFFENFNEVLGVTEALEKVLGAVNVQLTHMNNVMESGAVSSLRLAFVALSKALVTVINNIDLIVGALGGLLAGKLLLFLGRIVKGIVGIGAAAKAAGTLLAGLRIALTGVLGLAGGIGAFIGLLSALHARSIEASDAVVRNFEKITDQVQATISELERVVSGDIELGIVTKENALKQEETISRVVDTLNRELVRAVSVIHSFVGNPATKDLFRGMYNETLKTSEDLTDLIIDQANAFSSHRKLVEQLQKEGRAGDAIPFLGDPQKFKTAKILLESLSATFAATSKEISRSAKDTLSRLFIDFGLPSTGEFSANIELFRGVIDKLLSTLELGVPLQEALNKLRLVIPKDTATQLRGLLDLDDALSSQVSNAQEFAQAMAIYEEAIKRPNALLAEFRRDLETKGIGEERINMLVGLLRGLITNVEEFETKAFIRIHGLEDEEKRLKKLTNVVSNETGTIGKLFTDLQNSIDTRLSLRGVLDEADLAAEKAKRSIIEARQEGEEYGRQVDQLIQKFPKWRIEFEAALQAGKDRFPVLLADVNTAQKLFSVLTENIARLAIENEAADKEARQRGSLIKKLIGEPSEYKTSFEDFFAAAKEARDIQRAVQGASIFENLDTVISRAEIAKHAEDMRALGRAISDELIAKGDLEKLDNIFMRLKLNFPDVTKDLQTFEDLPEAFERIAKAQGEVDAFVEKVKEASAFRNITNAIRGVGSALLETIEDFVKSGTFKIKEFIDSILNEFLRLVLLRSIIEPLFNEVTGLIPQFVQSIGSSGGNAAGGGGGFVNVDATGFTSSPRAASGLTGFGAARGGGDVDVTVVDQRSSGPLPQISRGVGADGRQQLRVIIRDELGSALSDGSQDSTLGINYGVTRKAIRR